MRLTLRIGERWSTLTESRSQTVKAALEKSLKEKLTDEEIQDFLTENGVEMRESSLGLELFSKGELIGKYVPKVQDAEPYRRQVENQHKCTKMDDDFGRIVKINGKWLLQTSDDLDYEEMFINNETEISYCPFCGEKLK